MVSEGVQNGLLLNGHNTAKTTAHVDDFTEKICTSLRQNEETKFCTNRNMSGQNYTSTFLMSN